MDVLRALFYIIFLEKTFYGKKKNWFFDYFYISHKIIIKIFKKIIY